MAARTSDPPLATRFFAKVWPDPNTGCWLWQGEQVKGGYGRFLGDRGRELAHRFSYRVFRDEIPAGLQSDHHCKNPSCVNPDHIEIVTSKENNSSIRRANAQSKQTACKSGHLFSPENISITKTGSRRCRECHRIDQRRRNALARGVP